VESAALTRPTPEAGIANPARLFRTAKYKGRDSRHALCALLLRSGQDNPQTSGLKVVAARPHQAHPNEMARATANVLGNNRIIIL